MMGMAINEPFYKNTTGIIDDHDGIHAFILPMIAKMCICTIYGVVSLCGIPGYASVIHTLHIRRRPQKGMENNVLQP